MSVDKSKAGKPENIYLYCMTTRTYSRTLFLILAVSVLIACNRGYGCPSDQYNSFGSSKTKTNTKEMNSNKMKKSKKPVSDRMAPF